MEKIEVHLLGHDKGRENTIIYTFKMNKISRKNKCNVIK